MVLVDFLKDYAGEALALFLGGLIKWIFDKRKEKAEVTTTEIDNGSNVVKLYKEALDDLPLRYEKRFDDLNTSWEQKVKVLNEKFENLEKLSQEKERIMKDEISFVKRERDLWKKRYNDLNTEYQNYKKEHP